MISVNKFKSFSLEYLQKITETFSDQNLNQIKLLADELLKVWDSKGKVFMWKWRSAANANHISNDLHYGIGAMLKNKKNGLITESLAANNSLLTCLANDTGYENVFSNQLEVKANENDLILYPYQEVEIL